MKSPFSSTLPCSTGRPHCNTAFTLKLVLYILCENLCIFLWVTYFLNGKRPDLYLRNKCTNVHTISHTLNLPICLQRLLYVLELPAFQVLSYEQAPYKTIVLKWFEGLELQALSYKMLLGLTTLGLALSI